MHILVEKKSLTVSQGFAQNTLPQWQGELLQAPITLVGHTGSVLDDAWKLVAEDALPLWGAVLAQSQSEGRGQTRRQWHSPQGNIYLAMRLPMEGLFATTAAAPVFSLLVLLAMQNIGCSLQLKWPNDLVLGSTQQKVGGILLEEKKGVLLAGMGINVQEAPKEQFLRENHALAAGILPQIQGLESIVSIENSIDKNEKLPTNEALAIYLVSQIYFWYKKKLLTATAEKTWTDLAEAFLLWKGQEVELTDGQESTQGILQGLGSLGEIILNTRGHMQQCTNGSLRLKV